jgi:hypothetical protein
VMLLDLSSLHQNYVSRIELCLSFFWNLLYQWTALGQTPATDICHRCLSTNQRATSLSWQRLRAILSCWCFVGSIHWHKWTYIYLWYE